MTYARQECASWRRRRRRSLAKKAAREAVALLLCGFVTWAASAALLYAIAATAPRPSF